MFKCRICHSKSKPWWAHPVKSTDTKHCSCRKSTLRWETLLLLCITYFPWHCAHFGPSQKSPIQASLSKLSGLIRNLDTTLCAISYHFAWSVVRRTVLYWCSNCRSLRNTPNIRKCRELKYAKVLNTSSEHADLPKHGIKSVKALQLHAAPVFPQVVKLLHLAWHKLSPQTCSLHGWISNTPFKIVTSDVKRWFDSFE